MSSAKSGKDSTRAERKAKKRKLENAIPDLPGEDYNATGLQNEVTSTRKGSDRPTKKRKHEDHTQELISHNDTSEKAGRQTEVKSKKPRRVTSSDELNEELNSVDEKTMAGVDAKSGSALLLENGEPPRKTKKERKAERKIAEAAKASESAGTALSNPVLPPDSQSTPAAGTGHPTGKSKTNNRNREKQRMSKQNNEPMEKTDGKAPRFIVFIGNLPFTATTESIQKHFAPVHPKSVRHLTRKDEPAKSKGCAFVEFNRYDHMKSCLKSFHHSVFDDGISPPRKINVELTAGGGGNKRDRHAKIEEKNQKLNEERIRRIHEEDKAKLVKRDLAIDHNDVHPSRRARVPNIS